MSAEDSDASLTRAESLMAEALEILTAVRKARQESQVQASAVQSENEHLKRKLRATISENHALHIARKRLIHERNSDREVIRKWQLQLDDGSTQDPAAIPSSPPSVDLRLPTKNNNHSPAREPAEELSQPLLPQSVAIEASDDRQYDGPRYELDEHPYEPGNESQAESQNESLSQPNLTALGDSMNVKLESDVTTDAQQDISTSERGEVAIQVQPNLHEGEPLRPLQINTSGNHSVNRSSLPSRLQSLASKEWHPADFKLNPAYDSKIVLSRAKDNRKEHRRCLHGTGCQDCLRFYELTGLMGAIQAGSRHRTALDKQPTPAGYWAMDFPVSSQSQSDANVSQPQWLEEGRQRLEEALLGGRYVFRDEALNNLVEDFHQARE